MRKLFSRLNKMEVSWVFTDLVKCYVYDKKTDGAINFEMAKGHCRNYLNDQIRNLKPKLILTLGKTVFKQLTDFKNAPEHGVIVNCNKHMTIVHSIFPSERTANMWVKNGGWREVVRGIRNQLSGIPG